jgi:hypothetical protein
MQSAISYRAPKLRLLKYVSHLLISIRGLQVEGLCHLNFRLCKRGASWAVRSFAYAHRANVELSEARKQEGRSRLIHPSSWKYFVDGSSGMPWLTLGEYRLDRFSSGEQTGRACRKSAAVIASQSCWQREQHGCMHNRQSTRIGQ